jgi:hypothetical protein
MKYLAILTLIAAQTANAQGALQSIGHPGRLSGVYRAPAQANPAVSQGAQTKAGFFYLTFFPDGRVRRTQPELGLQGFDDVYQMNLDFRSGIPNDIRKWGTYRVFGEQGQIAFADRDVWNFSLKGYPRTIECQGRTYVLLDPGNGLTLQGTYKSTKDNDTFITFMTDGTMNQQGVFQNCVSTASFSLNSHGIPVNRAQNMFCVNKPLAGRYTVVNYTLELRLPNSSSPSFAFWPEPGGNRNKPDAVYIDNVRYVLSP